MDHPAVTAWTTSPGVTFPGGITGECTRCHISSEKPMTDLSPPPGWLTVGGLDASPGRTTCGIRRCHAQHYMTAYRAWLFCSWRCVRLYAQTQERMVK